MFGEDVGKRSGDNPVGVTLSNNRRRRLRCALVRPGCRAARRLVAPGEGPSMLTMYAATDYHPHPSIPAHSNLTTARPMPSPTSYLSDHQPRFLAELLDFLRIPSISAISAHAADVRRAADWVAARVTAAGMEHVQILPTGGHPVVYADWLHAPGKPTVMIYGHFDVQPVDPVALWTTPPFEPTIRDGRVYARGASDDKGNMLAPIQAVEALLKTEGALPLNV